MGYKKPIPVEINKIVIGKNNYNMQLFWNYQCDYFENI